jgi:replicative DNA helicase
MIVKSKELVTEAFKQLKRFQTGLDAPIITRYQHLNELSLGGLFAQTVTTIGGTSGSGKSYMSQAIEEDFLDKSMNPDADEHVVLRCNFEMTTLRMILRRLRRETGLTYKELLSKEFETGFQREIAERVYRDESSERVVYMEEAVTADEWFTAVDKFLNANKHKKRILISIDHLALMRVGAGDGKKGAMDTTMQSILILKKRYTNALFVILSQLNRDIDSRTSIPELAPRKSDLYSTDTLYHGSDVVVVLNNPAKLGYTKYMLVPTHRYAYLQEHLHNIQTKSTNFITEGRLFYHYLKIRDFDDIQDIQDIHIEMLK